VADSPQQRLDALVIGAGIVGLACARELRRHGLGVAVVDAQRPGSGATGASAGMLAPVSEADSLPRALGAPCCVARGLWPAYGAEIADESGVDPGYDSSPTIVPALGGEDLEFLDRVLMAAAELGERCEELTPDALRRRLPEARPGVERALLLPDEHRVDPALVTQALLESLRRRGVGVHPFRPVDRIEEIGEAVSVSGPGWQIEAGSALIAAGAWSEAILGLPPLPVRPVRGQMIAYQGLSWGLECACRSRHWYALGRSGQVLVGATVEEAGFDLTTTAAARDSLAAAASRLLPRLRGSTPSRQWAGLRPASPDGLPILGALGRNVFVATGHFRNGVLLAPWTAEVMAQLVTGSGEGPPPGFSPRRFFDSAGSSVGSRAAQVTAALRGAEPADGTAPPLSL
jgi:glycine oxidase